MKCWKLPSSERTFIGIFIYLFITRLWDCFIVASIVGWLIMDRLLIANIFSALIFKLLQDWTVARSFHHQVSVMSSKWPSNSSCMRAATVSGTGEQSSFVFMDETRPSRPAHFFSVLSVFKRLCHHITSHWRCTNIKKRKGKWKERWNTECTCSRLLLRSTLKESVAVPQTTKVREALTERYRAK